MTARALDPKLAAMLASIRQSVAGDAPEAADERAAEPPAEPAPPAAAKPASAPAGGQSLEAFIAGIAEPHIRAWLDAHLPELVQRQVQAAVERLVGRS